MPTWPSVTVGLRPHHGPRWPHWLLIPSSSAFLHSTHAIFSLKPICPPHTCLSQLCLWISSVHRYHTVASVPLGIFCMCTPLSLSVFHTCSCHSMVAGVSLGCLQATSYCVELSMPLGGFHIFLLNNLYTRCIKISTRYLKINIFLK